MQPAPLKFFSSTRNRLIAAGAVVVVLAVAVVVSASLLGGGGSASDKVSQYLDALIEGDAETALTLVDPSVSADARVLLTNEIYAAAGNRLTSYMLLEPVVFVDGESEGIAANLQLAGNSREVSFTVNKSDEGWTIAPIELRVISVMAAYSDTVQVNGIDVDVTGLTPEKESQFVNLPVFDGDYSVKVPDTEFFTSEAYTNPHLFEVLPTAELTAIAEGQYTSFLDDCFAAARADRAEGCSNFALKKNLADRNETAEQYVWSLTGGPSFGDVEIVSSAQISVNVAFEFQLDYITIYHSTTGLGDDEPIAHKESYGDQKEIRYDIVDGELVEAADKVYPDTSGAEYDED